LATNAFAGAFVVVVAVVGSLAPADGVRAVAVADVVAGAAAVAGGVSVGGGAVEASAAAGVGEIVAAVAAACPKLKDSIASVARDQPILFFIFPAPECSPEYEVHQHFRTPGRTDDVSVNTTLGTVAAKSDGASSKVSLCFC